jgi:phospholysine phosphohistidine inorganic pyrophosphate phosphatase
LLAAASMPAIHTYAFFGRSEHLTDANMNKAFRALMAMQTPLLYSLGKGRYFKEDGHLVLDVGSYTACLEFATGTKSVVVGKPEPTFFQTALEMVQAQPRQVGRLSLACILWRLLLNFDHLKAIMVGDDLVSDVGGAQSCGMRGILVRTGKFRPADECHPEVKPFHIADNLLEAVKHILKL